METPFMDNEAAEIFVVVVEMIVVPIAIWVGDEMGLDREEHHVHRVHDRDLEHFLLGTTSQLDVTHKFYLVTGE